MKNWSKKIKILREKHYLSQAKLAKLLGVTRNYIYLLEKEKRIPSKSLMLLFDYIEKQLEKEKEDKT